MKREREPPTLHEQMREAKTQAERERWQRTFAVQFAALRVPAPTPEYAFDPPRKWRFDFCYLDLKLAFEVEGGIWRPGGGAHQRPRRFLGDIVKYNRAAELGWRLFRFSGAQVESGEAAAKIAALWMQCAPRYIRRKKGDQYEPQEERRLTPECPTTPPDGQEEASGPRA